MSTPSATTEQSGKASRFTYLIQPLLLVSLAALAMAITARHETYWDLSSSARHTLTEPTRQILDTLDGPVTITAFASTRRDLRERIQRFAAPWLQHKQDMSLVFVDPATDPQQIRDRAITRDGEMLVSFAGREEKLDAPSAQAMANTLQRLARVKEHWLVFIEGHGERSPAGKANFDVSTWAQALRARGINVQTLALPTTAAIPTNASAVVLASPRAQLLPGEVDALVDYLNTGGHLLWLRDPDSPATGTAKLARALGIEWLEGAIVDPNTGQFGIDNPAMVVVSAYPVHAITQGFRYLSVFPFAGTVADTGGTDWASVGIFRTGSKAWHETGQLDDAVQFNPDEDFPGPLSLGLALERQLEGDSQRAMVIGDGDFLSNSFIGNAGNLELGTRIINWLIRDDSLIDIAPREIGDRQLSWSKREGLIIFFTQLLLIPVTIALTGLVRWHRRRKA